MRITLRSLSLLLFVMPIKILGATAEANHPLNLNGAELSLSWIVPFLGVLLSIAFLPLVLPVLWHHHFGKISFFWSTILIIPLLFYFGYSATLFLILHTALLEYVPFILLLLALFTISGGIYLSGNLVGRPLLNTVIILLGTVLASWFGTTGASMLLIRPLIRANDWRKHKVHIIVFFIFLVANVGGSLTPLGDPPLFLGFLQGVDFFWTTTAMLKPMVFVVFILITLFYIMDGYYYKKEDIRNKPQNDLTKDRTLDLNIEGKFNLILLLGVIFSVLMSGFWEPEISILLFNIELELQNIIRDILLILLIILSWKLTASHIRKKNEFTWFPIKEVGILFAGIFITIIPVIAILKSGYEGALSGIMSSLTLNGEPINLMYFWVTGILSSFLDNAPTYLILFMTASGDAGELMGAMYHTLLAISAGAVFMGANTYIGNAPNFLVKSIAESSGISMPSFFGYIFKYSLPILIPVFILVSLIFF